MRRSGTCKEKEKIITDCGLWQGACDQSALVSSSTYSSPPQKRFRAETFDEVSGEQVRFIAALVDSFGLRLGKREIVLQSSPAFALRCKQYGRKGRIVSDSCCSLKQSLRSRRITPFQLKASGPQHQYVLDGTRVACINRCCECFRVAGERRLD